MNVLFVCTANSARSIISEAYLNHTSDGAVKAFSAGSRPSGTVNPHALALLESKGIRTHALRSKSWAEFSRMSDAPIDVLITVCDNAAHEECPHIPGVFARAHWGVPDPAAAPAERRAEAFEQAFAQLKGRIDKLLDLPLERIARASLQDALAVIGRP